MGALDFIYAMVHLIQTRHGKTYRINHDACQFSIVEVTTIRFVCSMVTGILQLGIALSLLVSGSLWLVRTTSIADLMLNAVALSYVMQLDELIYSVLVPKKVTMLVQNMEPLMLGSELLDHE